MTKPIGLTKKRKFHGNRQTASNTVPVTVNAPDKEVDGASEVKCDNKTDSASKKKCKHIDSCDPETFGDSLNSGNIILDLSLFNQVVNSSVCCKFCKSGSVRVTEIISKRRGLASFIQLVCDTCQKSSSSYSSLRTPDNYFEVNMRFVYGMRGIGKGQQGAESLCATMNLPPPPTHFPDYSKVLGKFCENVAKESMHEAAKEAGEFHISENQNDCDIDDDSDAHSNYDEVKKVAVILDGSWQKRGHTSMNGFVSASSFDTGKILDVECMTKFCHKCSRSSVKPCRECQKNYEGVSGGMETQGALTIFNRSEPVYNLQYVRYLGDGDSKGFQEVLQNTPYGEDIEISKLEYVGHVQKRKGTRLRNLKKTMKGKTLSDGKLLYGKGRLTIKAIDSLQNYYGLAIRRNTGNLEAMHEAVWAIFFHKLSTDEKPHHSKCPEGKESWCGFQKAKGNQETYTHKNSLPSAVLDAIQPIFRDLSQNSLLEKCQHGKTQNVNECFNGVVWSRLPKTVFIGLETFKLGVHDSVITFNEGNLGRVKVLQHITGGDVGVNSIVGYKQLDKRRVYKADRAQEERQKQKRKGKRGAKRKLEDEEEFYIAGAFD